MKSIRFETVFYFFAVIIGLSFLSMYHQPIKYLKYLLLPISFFIAMPMLSREDLDVRQFKPMLGFIVIILHALVISPILASGFNNLMLKDIYFISSYVFPLVLFFEKTTDIALSKIFGIYALSFLLTIPGLEIKAFDVLRSSAPLESSACFVAGAFVLYFLFRKKYLLVLIAAVIMLLSLKRIALLGVLVSAFFWYSPVLKRTRIVNKYTCTIVGGLFIYIFYLIYHGNFDALIQEYTGMNPQLFTMGRLAHWGGVFDEIRRNPSLLIFGKGAGAGYEYAAVYKYLFSKTYVHEHYNLHSDLLKILFEYGIFTFVLFFTSLFAGLCYQARLLVLYLFILFLTDNVLIYVQVMFFVMLIILQVDREVKKMALKKT